MYVSPADFPQVWQKPSYEDLITCLRKLRIDPPIWNPSTSRRLILEDHENSVRFRREIASYLANIVKSDLRWITDDTEKEALWEEASKRLSERCGRAGMGEITRRWPFTSPSFELIVREPALTGDALGLKTWGSSYFLAQQLEKIADQSLMHILSTLNTDERRPWVLELGSGTGLLGMAAAAMWKTHVTLSDLPNIIPNLSFNVEANRQTVESLGGKLETGALTWGGPPEDNDEIFALKNQFKIILAADPLYDDDHPQLLASAIEDHLTRNDMSRVVAMIPQRDLTTRRLTEAFKDQLAACDWSLSCLEEHTLMGQDDWDDGQEEQQIECWWGIFGSQAIG